MREDLIDSIHDRLDEMRHEVPPEQSREIREIQQLVVGVRSTDQTPPKRQSADD